MDQPSSRRSFLRNVGLGTLGAVAAGGLFEHGRRPDARQDDSRRGRGGHLATPQGSLETRLRPEDPRRHRRLRRLPVRRAVRLSRSSQRHRDGGERPLSRPLPGAGPGLPLPEDLSFAGRDGQGRGDRGHFPGDRRPQPRPARHRRAQARQARGHGGAGRLRLAGGCRQAAGDGQAPAAAST